MKSRIAALTLVPIIGAILGYLFAGVIDNQWLIHSWKMIEKPPIKVQRLVAINSFSLWVQSDKGKLYYNEDTVECKSDCWKEVSSLPVLPIINPDETVTNTACSIAPPLWGILDKLSQCRIEEFNWGHHSNFTYALRNDGTIYLWDIYYYTGEGGPIFTYISYTCFGGIAFFIFTLILVIYASMIDWLRTRAIRRQSQNNRQ